MKLFDFSGLRKSVRGIGAEVAGLREQIERLRQQRDQVEHAPAARTDVLAALTAHVQARGALLAPMMAKQIAALACHPAKLDTPSWAKNAGPASPVIARFGGVSPQALDVLLAGVAGELVIAAIGRVIDAMDWPEGEGLPMKARAVELARLDKEIGAAMAEEKTLVSEARAAGIVFEVQ